jgi:hypothetical protein
MKLTILLALLSLSACRDTTAPKACDISQATDSLMIPFEGDTVPQIKVKWCGPITVTGAKNAAY